MRISLHSPYGDRVATDLRRPPLAPAHVRGRPGPVAALLQCFRQVLVLVPGLPVRRLMRRG